MPFIDTLKMTVTFVAVSPVGLWVSSTPYFKTAQIHMNSPKVCYF